MRRGWWFGLRWAIKRRIGILLNRALHLDLELCAVCGRYTTWDDDRLWGGCMLCGRCDQTGDEELAAMEREGVGNDG